MTKTGQLGIYFIYAQMLLIHSHADVASVARGVIFGLSFHDYYILCPSEQQRLWQVCAYAQTSLSLLLKTVNPVINGHLKIDEATVLMENDSLMELKVLQNAPRVQNAPLGAFCNTFDLH